MHPDSNKFQERYDNLDVDIKVAINLTILSAIHYLFPWYVYVFIYGTLFLYPYVYTQNTKKTKTTQQNLTFSERLTRLSENVECKFIPVTYLVRLLKKLAELHPHAIWLVACLTMHIQSLLTHNIPFIQIIVLLVLRAFQTYVVGFVFKQKKRRLFADDITTPTPTTSTTQISTNTNNDNDDDDLGMNSDDDYDTSRTNNMEYLRAFNTSINRTHDMKRLSAHNKHDQYNRELMTRQTLHFTSVLKPKTMPLRYSSSPLFNTGSSSSSLHTPTPSSSSSSLPPPTFTYRLFFVYLNMHERLQLARVNHLFRSLQPIAETASHNELVLSATNQLEWYTKLFKNTRRLRVSGTPTPTSMNAISELKQLTHLTLVLTQPCAGTHFLSQCSSLQSLTFMYVELPASKLTGTLIPYHYSNSTYAAGLPRNLMGLVGLTNVEVCVHLKPMVSDDYFRALKLPPLSVLKNFTIILEREDMSSADTIDFSLPSLVIILRKFNEICPSSSVSSSSSSLSSLSSLSYSVSLSSSSPSSSFSSSFSSSSSLIEMLPKKSLISPAFLNLDCSCMWMTRISHIFSSGSCEYLKILRCANIRFSTPSSLVVFLNFTPNLVHLDISGSCFNATSLRDDWPTDGEYLNTRMGSEETDGAHPSIQLPIPMPMPRVMHRTINNIAEGTNLHDASPTFSLEQESTTTENTNGARFVEAKSNVRSRDAERTEKIKIEEQQRRLHTNNFPYLKSLHVRNCENLNEYSLTELCKHVNADDLDTLDLSFPLKIGANDISTLLAMRHGHGHGHGLCETKGNSSPLPILSQDLRMIEKFRNLKTLVLDGWDLGGDSMLPALPTLNILDVRGSFAPSLATAVHTYPRLCELHAANSTIQLKPSALHSHPLRLLNLYSVCNLKVDDLNNLVHARLSPNLELHLPLNFKLTDIVMIKKLHKAGITSIREQLSF